MFKSIFVICMGFIIGYIVVSFFVDGEKDKWLTIVYPDRNNLMEYHQLERYVLLDTCRTAANHALQVNGWEETGAFECGLNCKKDKNIDLWLCEETRQ